MGQADYNQGTRPFGKSEDLRIQVHLFITKNSLETVKPIAAKLQKKDQDIFQAMIDDTIKAVNRVRSNRIGIP